MRVTHVITRLIVGGAQENTISTVLGMQRPGVLSELLSGPTTGPEGSLEKAFDHLPGALTIIPTLVRPIRPWLDIKAFFNLKREFLQRKPAIVHTHSGKAGIIGRMAAYSAGVPIIIHSIHGPSFGPWQNPPANAVFIAAEKYVDRCTTHFIAVAGAMIQQYLAVGIGTPSKYSRIFSGFNLSPFLTAENSARARAELGISPGDFVVGKIARLFKLKGHDDLIAAAPRIIQALPHVKFLLVGGGPWEERFKAQVNDLGLNKNFVFTGLVPPSSIPGLVGLMDILAHLSLREGLPRALPQALAAAKPIVAYDCDGAGEVCLENVTGYLVRPRDIETVTSRIIELGADTELRERLGTQGQDMVKSLFPVEKMVESIFALYQKLLPTAQA